MPSRILTHECDTAAELRYDIQRKQRDASLLSQDISEQSPNRLAERISHECVDVGRAEGEGDEIRKSEGTSGPCTPDHRTRDVLSGVVSFFSYVCGDIVSADRPRWSDESHAECPSCGPAYLVVRLRGTFNGVQKRSARGY